MLSPGRIQDVEEGADARRMRRHDWRDEIYCSYYSNKKLEEVELRKERELEEVKKAQEEKKRNWNCSSTVREESERRLLEAELESVKKCQEEKKKSFNPASAVKTEKSQLELELEALRLQQVEKKKAFKPEFEGKDNEDE